jgi:hypothetical protein
VILRGNPGDSGCRHDFVAERSAVIDCGLSVRHEYITNRRNQKEACREKLGKEETITMSAGEEGNRRKKPISPEEMQYQLL